MNHWIPNTGEAFVSFNIKITADSFTGEDFRFSGDFTTFDIFILLDNNFNSSETGEENIHTNKATC